MNDKTKEAIEKSLSSAITHLARRNGVFNEDIEKVFLNTLLKDDGFVVVQWPEIQSLMELEGFHENASLANDEWSIDEYGSSAYFVRLSWLNQLTN